MRVSRMTVVLAVSVIVAMVCGCATMRGPSPTEEATAALASYHTALEAMDVEKIMTAFSDDYSNSQGATKPMVRDLFAGLAGQGFILKVEKSDIVVEGDSASGTVVYGSAMGSTTYKFSMKKEDDGVWRIVNTEQVY